MRGQEVYAGEAHHAGEALDAETPAILVSPDSIHKAASSAVIPFVTHSCLSELVRNLSAGAHNDGPARLRINSLVIVSPSSVKRSWNLCYVSSATDVN